MSIALPLLVVAFQSGQKPPPDEVLGSPPVNTLGTFDRGKIPPPDWSRDGPDGDDVQVSSPSKHNQTETVIRVNPIDRDHLIGGANDNRLGFDTCAFYTSRDGGRRWNEFLYRPPSGFTARHPSAAFGPNGEVYFCLVASRSKIYVGQSFDGALKVNWVQAVGGSGCLEFSPFMVADCTTSSLSGAIYVTWTRQCFWNPIYMVASFDQGSTWTYPKRLSDSENAGGACPAVGPNGELYVAFVDRENSRYAISKSLDGGATWGTDVEIVRNLDCRLPNAVFQHGCGISLDVDTSSGPYRGNVYAVITDYQPADDSTDILLYLSKDGGQKWSKAIRVTDDTDQTSQFFPWIDVDVNGNVNVGFMDRRGGRGADIRIGYGVARSSDGGTTFQPNVMASDRKFNPSKYAQGAFIGTYTGLAASDRTLHPLWTDGRNRTNDVFTSRVQLDIHTDNWLISAATGGQVQFTLNPGPLYQGATYRIVGSISGTTPGFTFPTGVNLPLNFDTLFLFTLVYANTSSLQSFAGTLDATGSATATLDTLGPLDPSLVGLHMDFAAYVEVGGLVRWASNPTGVDIDS